MSKRIVITEEQFIKLSNNLLLENDYRLILSSIISFLDNNYELVNGTFKDYHDYFNKPMFKVLVDGNIITPKDLLEYLKIKYHGTCGEEFLKQVISDWAGGTIVDGWLSKNTPLK